MYNRKFTPAQIIGLIKDGNVSAKQDSFIDVTQKLAKITRDYRAKYGLTNKEMANRIGITTSILSRVESGTENLSMRTVCRVLDAMNCKMVFKTHDEE